MITFTRRATRQYHVFYTCAKVYVMVFSDNGLWKVLIDKGITKTKSEKGARICTNVLAKMGKIN